MLSSAQHMFLQLTLLQERKMWNWLHMCTHKTQAKLHRTLGGGLGSVSGSQPQGYNGKAKNDRTCGLLNILLDFATSCQWQCPGKGTQYHKFLNKSMAQPDMDKAHILTREFFQDNQFRPICTKYMPECDPRTDKQEGLGMICRWFKRNSISD